MKKSSLILLSAMVFSLNAIAQPVLKTPAPSPSQTVTQAFGLGEVKVEYSRPSVKGRVIYGDLVPFAKIWRTGANNATKITFADTVKVGGTVVPNGTYAIYTMPGQSEWEVMLYKDLTLGGDVDNYKTDKEAMRIKVKTSTLSDKVETFTIAFNDVTTTSCNLDLMWDKTKVSIPLSADIDTKIMSNIEAIMIKDKRPYFASANYYYENGKDLNKALEWVNKAVAENPNAYWMSHLKAKILLKQNDYKGAIAAATISLEKATADNDGSYIKQNEKLIADAKKMVK